MTLRRAIGFWALLLAGAPLIAGAPTLAGEVTATGGALGLGTAVNGLVGGSCGAGLCQVGGGTAAGSNLFHRFSAFDTRGGITGVNFFTGGLSNVFVGVTSPAGSFIDKLVSFSSPANLFWLSPGGISLGGAGGFANIQQLNLSTATGWRVGNGVFDAAGTTAGQAALLKGAPVTGLAGAVNDPASLAALGLQKNGDLSLSGGLLTVDQGLLLDAQGGNVLLQAAGIQSPGGRVEIQGATVNQGSTPIDVSNPTGPGGRIAITGGTVVQSGALKADGSRGGDVTIQAASVVGGASIQARGLSGEGGGISVRSSGDIVQTVAAQLDASGSTVGGRIKEQAGGELFSSASLTAAGTGAGAKGGTIEVSAPTVTLAAAQLDASGNGGGGAVRVGGGYQGSALSLGGANATTTNLSASSTLKADAIANGNGGQVVVWSEKATDFKGAVSARGGAQGGNGGVLEVSGKADLVFGGTADAAAPAGQAGQLLLDPKNIYIDAANPATYVYNIQNIVYPGSAPDKPTSLVKQLPNGSVVVNVPTGGASAIDSSGAVYLFDGTTYGLLTALYGTAEVTAADLNYSNGKLILTSRSWNGSAGAATWIDTATGKFADGTTAAPISSTQSLVGSSNGDFKQASVSFLLTTPNALVFTPNWNGPAGALSWINGSTGKLSDGTTGGAISSTNSLLNTASAAYLPDPAYPTSPSYVKSTALEFTGGNLLIYSGQWNGGKGALTWLNGSTGALADGSPGGAISVANSLVGSTVGDLAPNYSGGFQYNSDPSAYFSQGGNILDPPSRLLIEDPVTKVVLGSVVKESVALLRNPYWDNGTATDAGAITWIDVATGKLGDGNKAVGVIRATNSLVGSSKDDLVGQQEIDLGGYNTRAGISNQGYFAFLNPTWDNGTATDAGAVTWLRASTGRLSTGAPIIGTVGPTNSLVGGSSNDQIGNNSYEPIRQGSYFGSVFTNLLLTSSSWDKLASGPDPAISDAGALTWIQGATGQLSNGLPAIGVIGAANSLVGGSTGDLNNLTFQQLSDSVPFDSQLYSNLLISTPNWTNGSAAGAGAITWLNGGTGKLATDLPSFGAIGASTSLVGTTAGDKVGGTAADLTIFSSVAGKFESVLIRTPTWNNDRGAITWLNGTTGKLADGNSAVGAIDSTQNSLVGSTAGDKVGSNLTLLGSPNSQPYNFLVSSPDWASGAGALTWINGATGKLATLAPNNNPFGVLGAANSLVGSAPGDGVGSAITTTKQGNLLLLSPSWSNKGTAAGAGALTWIKASTGGFSFANADPAVGEIGAANSLVGGSAGDATGATITPVGSSSDPNYVLRTPNWNNKAGAVTWLSGATGKLADGNNPFNLIGSTNSLVGSTSGDQIGATILTGGNVGSSPGTNLVLLSPSWSNGGAAGAGAVTWINGATGKLADDASLAKGFIDNSNSLVGTSTGDGVGSSSDRNFGSKDTLLLRSTAWSNGKGAITWFDLATGKLANATKAIGDIGSANSLVGTNAGDQVGLNFQTYGSVSLLGSPFWSNSKGAVTWIDRATGKTPGGLNAFGSIDASNSLLGSSTNDRLGIFSINEFPVGGCASGTTCRSQTYLTTYNFNQSVLIGSPNWTNGSLASAGAITAVNLSDGKLVGSASYAVGAVDATNSLVGSGANEQLGMFRRNDQLADGSQVVENNVGLLGTGAAVVASPRWSSGTATNVGAVAIIGSSGRTGTLSAVNALVGSSPGDFVGFGVRSIGSAGNGLLFTPKWDNGSVADAGAVTWINGLSGLLANGAAGGTIGAATSLLGSSTGDFTGYSTQTLNGNALVHLPGWDNGGVSDAGALSWINASSGKLANAATGGAVGPSNSIVGSSSGDLASYQLRTVGFSGNGLLSFSSYDNGAIANAGALTWINGSTGLLANGALGPISTANSLVGTATGDFNGFYLSQLSFSADSNALVVSPFWDLGGSPDAGAITWLNTSTGRLSDGSTGGTLGGTNSLLATGASYTGPIYPGTSYTNSVLQDTFYPYREIGSGNVLIYSAGWANAAGALTWLNGKTGGLADGSTGGVIGAANSLVGSAPGDLQPNSRYPFRYIAQDYFTYNLNTSGNGLLLRNAYWGNQAGAVTWLNASTGKLGDGRAAVGTIGAANSLVGSTAGDLVGSNAQVYSGNLLLFTPYWDNPSTGAVDAGAVTWINPTTGKFADGTNLFGPVGAANTLAGSSSYDYYGSNYGLYNNNLVINAPYWDNGAAANAGAVTWLNPSNGTLADGRPGLGAVGAANSLVGSSAADLVGLSVQSLSSTLGGNNLALISRLWDNGLAVDAGAVTWINTANGLLANGNPALGAISAANSLVGTTSGDRIGANALEVGYYYANTGTNLLVLSGSWDNGSAVDAGAVTWINGLTGQLISGSAAVGAVNRYNSIVGSTAGDQVGADYVTMGSLSSSPGLNVLLKSPNWDNGAFADAGAVTWINGQNGLMVNQEGTGGLNAANSLIGNSTGDKIGRSVDVTASDTFFVNGPGETPPGTSANNVVAQKVRIVPGSNYSLASAGIVFGDAAGASVTISPSQIFGITSTGTALVLQASNDILLRTNSTLTSGSGALTLQAGRSITLNSNLNTTNANLTLIANDPGADQSLRDPGAASIVQRSGTSINTGFGTASFSILPSTPTAEAGTVALTSVTAARVNVSAPAIALSRSTLTAIGFGSAPASSAINLNGTGRLSIGSSTLIAQNGGAINLDGQAITVGGSTLLASNTAGDGGRIAIGALSTPALPSSVSLTSSTLDATGNSPYFGGPTALGGSISIDGGFIALSGVTANTSGTATGGSIAIGGNSAYLPSAVSIQSSSLVADPAGQGGAITVNGFSIYSGGNTFNVVGGSGGSIYLGSALANLLTFGSGNNVIGGGNGLFTFQANQIVNLAFAPYSGGTLTVICPGCAAGPLGPGGVVGAGGAAATGGTGLTGGSLFSLPGLVSSLFGASPLNVLNLQPVTGSAVGGNQGYGIDLFGSSDPSLVATVPLKITLNQTSMLFVDGFLDQLLLDPGLVGQGPQDGQKVVKPLDQVDNVANRGDDTPVIVTDVLPSEAEVIFLRGERSAQSNATTKLAVEPEPGAEPLNVLKLQEWLRQVVPVVQQRLRSSR